MKTWKDKAKSATRGTHFGAILAAALGEEIPAPCFNGKASVTSDGFLMADFIGADGRYHMGAFVGSVEDLEGNIAGLTKHLKLNVDEAFCMRTVFHNWVGRDWRN